MTVEAMVTLGLAVYGAVLSSINALSNMRRDMRDVGRLKLSMMVGRVHSGGGPAIRFYETPDGPMPINLSDQDRVFLTITNVGRRPITVQQVCGAQGPRQWVGWRLRREQFVVGPQNLPRTLNPGEYLVEWLFDHPSQIAIVRKLYVLDTTGHAWNVPRRLLHQTKIRAAMPEESAESAPTSAPPTPQ